ncbi:MAG: hypothetical protein IKO65_07490 [Victivallales bacterium]|nr:hypothetical protein [Victivallales bacterium]
MPSSMLEMPMGIGLIPCDQIIEDRLTGKKSLIGVIGEIRANKFPLRYPALFLLVSLTGGRGEYPCRLQILSASQNEEIFSSRGRLKFKNPTQVVDLVFTLPALQFKYEDTYWVKFMIDEVTLMTRPLRVTEVQIPPPPPLP